MNTILQLQLLLLLLLLLLLQGVKKNRAPFHITLVYFYLFANLNETFYALTIKRPKKSTVDYKGCDN